MRWLPFTRLTSNFRQYSWRNSNIKVLPTYSFGNLLRRNLHDKPLDFVRIKFQTDHWTFSELFQCSTFKSVAQQPRTLVVLIQFFKFFWSKWPWDGYTNPNLTFFRKLSLILSFPWIRKAWKHLSREIQKRPQTLKFFHQDENLFLGYDLGLVSRRDLR